MDFGGLAGKVGGTAKEAARGALTDGLLNLTGQGAMTGQVKYADYKYDANGHIKGVNTKFAKEVESRYESIGVANTTGQGIDGSFGGLTTGSPRSAKTSFIEKYPGKYDSSTNNYNNFKLSYEKEIKEAEARREAADQHEQEERESWQKDYEDNWDYSEGDPDKMVENAQEINDRHVDSYTDAKQEQDAAHRDEAAIKQKQNDLPTLYGLLYNNVSTDDYNKYDAADNQNKVVNNPISDIFSIKLPDWSYADFINERAIWQKGLSSIFDEPGWFYFKIFFDFDTDHGLFGGLLNSKYLTNAVNSAAKYLYSIRNLHRYVKPKDRINSLYKFASILSYINTNAPWYFKSVKGLNKAAIPIIDDFSKENSIELEVTQDAIDMRLSTLMSLYNYACFDSLTDREIIPPNLRKFNMSVIIFQTPLRYLHTSYTSNKKTEFMGIDVGGVVDEVGGLFGKKKKGSKMIKYKTMKPDHGGTGNYQYTMSMKVYSFFGCEFDRESFASIIPGSVSNETPFQLGNSSIKITYTSCAEHTMNEFYAMMFGTDGFYFNQYSNYQMAINEGGTWDGYVAKNEEKWNEQLDRYQSLYDTFEDIAQGGTILGLVDKPKTYKKAIDATEAIMNGLFDNPGMLKGLATNFALGLLGSSKDTKAPQGNIYGDYGIGSAYYKDKLEMLKNGVHENTMAPYYYDPDTGARVDFHKDKQYSAYNYKNDVSTIKNFNVTNWLSTQTQKFASGINDKLRSGMDSLFGYDTGDFTQQPYKPNPYNKDTAQETDAKKWEGVGKSHDMVDDPTIHSRVEKPFTYDSKEAINYENKKITSSDKTKNQTMVDDVSIWNRTTKPYVYDAKEAINIENNKIEKDNKTKNQTMVDNQSTQSRVEKPFTYDAKEALNYENSKADSQYKNQSMTDSIGNSEHEHTMAPYKYEPKDAVDKEYEKEVDVATKDMVDIKGNPENQVTEAPFNYDPKEALNYENSKAGGQYKNQSMTDSIGNSEHEHTMAPYKYEPKDAVDKEYEKEVDVATKDMVDIKGNPENQVTEAPFNYDPKEAVNYENSKAGDTYKSQDMVNNSEHKFTLAPYKYEPKDAVDKEYEKEVDVATKDMVDIKGNPENQVTEAPFNYDPKEAINYENSKAGGQYKNQSMTDSIGNPEHEHTMAPYKYEPKDAVDKEYEKEVDVATKDMVDIKGNPENQVTEAPFNYDPKEAVNYENSKAGGQYKNQSMTDSIGNPEHEHTMAPYKYEPKDAVDIEYEKEVDVATKDMVDIKGNPENQVTEAPFNYDPKEAVNYEYEKEVDVATKDMVDIKGNPENQVTEAPFNYDPKEAVNYENSKAGGQYKNQSMVDGIGNPEHEHTMAPYKYEPKDAVDIEYEKEVDVATKDMVDIKGNPENQVTEAPFNYNPKEAVNYEYEKEVDVATKDMVDIKGNPENQVTEAPFNYDPKEAVNYENSKAGGQYKNQSMVDGIGNPEHEYTMAPYNYNPKEAVNYEYEKEVDVATKDMVDIKGNPENQVTEAPFNYDPKEAVNYENSKAGDEYKSQDMVNNNEHKFTMPPYSFK